MNNRNPQMNDRQRKGKSLEEAVKSRIPTKEKESAIKGKKKEAEKTKVETKNGVDSRRTLEEEKQRKKHGENEKKRKKVVEMKQKKVEEVEHYEEDFEDYESDFEEDEEEAGQRRSGLGNKKKDGPGPEENAHQNGDQGEESLLMKKLSSVKVALEGGLNSHQNGRVETIFVPEERELAIGEEKPGAEEGREGEPGGSEWRRMAEYFQEIAGQNERRKQCWAQTNRAELSIGSQTEPVESESREVQLGRAALPPEREEQPREPRLLSHFVHEAEQLFMDLLNLPDYDDGEGGEGRGQLLMAKDSPNLAFSSQYSSFSLDSLFKESRICSIALKNIQTICLCIFVPNSDDLTQNRRSFAAEFPFKNTNSQSNRSPTSLMCCDNEVSFLRYSPNSSALFAALKDGSLVAWDLRMAPTPLQGSRVKEAVLLPVANTAFDPLFDQTAGWNGPDKNWADLGIVGMEVLEGGGGRTIAQLVVLHESGLIRCWTAMDTDTTGGSGGNSMAHPLKGTIQMVPTSSAQPMDWHNRRESEFASCLAIHGQSGTFLGTSRARILRVNRVNGKGDTRDGPSVYVIEKEGSSEVTALKFPRAENSGGIFAAATSGQKIFLFGLTRNEPLKVLHSPASPNLAANLLCPILLEWAPSGENENLLYSIHAGEFVVSWRRGERGTWREVRKEVSQFYVEFRARIQSSLGWRDNAGNGFLVFGLSNGELQVHQLK